MEPADEAVVRHYEAVREEGRISEGFGRLELLRAQEALRRHLPPPPAGVLDVGGATGVHAAWLAADGYRVHLVDLAPRHVAEANAELGRLGVTAERGDARQLPVPDSAYDAVLLFGPLYHLTERRDRLRALREAARVARPGAIVAVAAVSRFASLFEACRASSSSAPGSALSRPRTCRTASTATPTSARGGGPPPTSTTPTSSATR